MIYFHRLRIILLTLFIFLVVSGKSYAQEAGANWPSNIILSGFDNAPVGTVLASVDVNQSLSGYAASLFTGEYYALFGFNGTGEIYGDPRSGVFKLSNDIGIAFIGNVTASTNSKSATFTKTIWNSLMAEQVYNRGERAGFNLLSGVLLENAFGRVTVSVTGKVILVKLTAGQITPAQLNLPNLTLRVCGGWSIADFSYTNVLVSGAGTSIINPRICQISLLNSPNIDFGLFFSNHPQGAMVSDVESRFQVLCNGKNTVNNPIYLEIKPTLAVSSDSRAIGLTISGDDKSPSDSLVVKAKLRRGDTTSCTTIEGGWAALSPTRHSLGTISMSSETHTSLHSIYWTLCKLKAENLPAGTFTGSATISFTFN